MRATFVIGVMVTTALWANAVIAAEVPESALKKGRLYAAARVALRRSGWVPVRPEDRSADDLAANSFGDAGDMIAAGLTEVMICGGTGANICEFRWKHGDRCLRVFTRGEYIQNKSPRLDSHWVESCSKLAAEP